jgi:hypothetical protein
VRVVCATSNRYVHLLPAFARCVERFWPTGPPVAILHYDISPPAGLSPRFAPFCGGVQSATRWSAGLRRWLSTVPDDGAPVLLLLDDYWLCAPVDAARLAELEVWMVAAGVDKLDLSGDRLRFPHDPHPARPDLVVALADPWLYRPAEGFKTRLFLASIQAALWRVDFLRGLLRDDESAWEMEANGTARLVGARRGSIVGVREPVLRYANATKAGKPQLLRADHIPPALLADLRAAGLLRPWGIR